MIGPPPRGKRRRRGNEQCPEFAIAEHFERLAHVPPLGPKRFHHTAAPAYCKFIPQDRTGYEAAKFALTEPLEQGGHGGSAV